LIRRALARNPESRAAYEDTLQRILQTKWRAPRPDISIRSLTRSTRSA
jgi:hypothetical protein